MPEEFRVIGPPGTGKTTYVKANVESAVSKHGAHSVLLASLTRAAAAELAGRGMPIPKEAIGTIHAHAYRSIGRQELALNGGWIKEWNREASQLARWEMTGDDADTDDGLTVDRSGKKPGDEALHAYSVARSQMIPRALWNPNILHFAKAWEDFKAQTHTIDFTDMIEVALEHSETAPGRPAFIFLDEAQDVDKLQFALVRKWASHAVKLIAVGDPLQNLYEWRGTSPGTMLEPELPKEFLRVLGQSYRVPAAVHAVAAAWVKRHANYRHFEYAPRGGSLGEVRSIECDESYPVRLVPDMEQYLQAGKTIMVLASCEYVLWNALSELKEHGVAFHNPYRVKNGAWNLFRHRDKILDYLQTDEELWGDHAGLWTWSQLRHWIHDFESAGFLHHGAKAQIDRCAKDPDLKNTRLTISSLREIFLPSACEVNNLAWYRDKCCALKKKLASTGYVLRVAEKRGKKALLDPPRVIVGTIHSVKGGEADVVYLFPNLSPQGLQAWHKPARAEYSAIVRQFYVGLTRARETLVICQQTKSAKNGIPAWELT